MWSVFDKSQSQKSIGTHWVLLFIDRNTAVYFDFFEIEYIAQEVLNKIKEKLITHNRFKFEKWYIILLAYFRG